MPADFSDPMTKALMEITQQNITIEKLRARAEKAEAERDNERRVQSELAQRSLELAGELERCEAERDTANARLATVQRIVSDTIRALPDYGDSPEGVAGAVAALRRRAEKAEAGLALWRQRISEIAASFGGEDGPESIVESVKALRAERDEARAAANANKEHYTRAYNRVAELEAQAGAMREAMEWFRSNQPGMVFTGGDERRFAAALSSDAGRALIEERNALRAAAPALLTVAEAAKRLDESVWPEQWMWDNLHTALAALDAGGGR